MRKKLVSNTYLRDVKDYILNIYCDLDDVYIAVKKIKKVNSKFIVKDKIIIDNNYYILELLPKNEKYAMRVYFNEKKEILEYYFDISMGNGLDEKTRIPYYDDLYLDIIIFDNTIEVLDEDELIEALEEKKITKEVYDMAYKTLEKLLTEIKNKTNKYINMDLTKYL